MAFSVGVCFARCVEFLPDRKRKCFTPSPAALCGLPGLWCIIRIFPYLSIIIRIFPYLSRGFIKIFRIFPYLFYSVVNVYFFNMFLLSSVSDRQRLQRSPGVRLPLPRGLFLLYIGVSQPREYRK